MELSLAPLTLHRPHPLDAIDAAAAAGYDLTGIQLGLYGQPMSPLVRDKDFLDEARARVGRGGIAVLEVSNIVVDDEFTEDDAESLVAFARGVGARLVQAVCWDPEFDRAATHLDRAAALAAEEGLDVALEFMPYSSARTLGDALALLNASGRENLRLLLDSLHFFRSGGAVDELARLPRGKVAVIQLSDAPRATPSFDELRPESLANRLIPGSGELPLAEFLTALPDDAPISLEVPSRALEGLPLAEQARAVLDGSRRFLDSLE
jgi:sugar phosphate isomerase/epimerase